MNYVYYGHHRCASLWTLSIVSSVCHELGLSIDSSAVVAQIPENPDDIDFFCHINASPELMALLDGDSLLGFHVIRDPRDILISSYFSSRYSHEVYSKEFSEYRDALSQLDFDSGLNLELERRRFEFEAIYSWDYDNPRIFETKYETLTTEPIKEFSRIFSFLGLQEPNYNTKGMLSLLQFLGLKSLRRFFGRLYEIDKLPPGWLRVIVDRNSFKRKAGRDKGELRIDHHYRKGIAGDWKNYIKGKQKEKFKDIWGDLLVRLDYEKDFDW